MPDEPYAYLDFAVVVAPQIDVLYAIATIRAGYQTGPEDLAIGPVFEVPPADPEAREAFDVLAGREETTKRRGMFALMGSLFRAWIAGDRAKDHDDAAPSEDASSLFLHCDEGADLDRWLTWSFESKISSMPIEARVSALTGRPGWTILEFADPGSGMSYTSQGVSSALPGAPVYYFRRSGDEADQPHFDFHCYQDGAQTRRVMSHMTRPKGGGSPWWEGYNEGRYLPFEDPILYDRADESVMITANKQLALLEKMGLSIAELFGPGARDMPILLSDKQGGAPVSILYD